MLPGNLDNLSLFFLEGKFVIGILIFIRITGMMVTGPFIKSTAIPIQVKVMLAVLLATTITQAYYTEQPAIEFHLWNIALLAMKESLVGMIFGFSANFVFYGARMAGGIIDTDMGYQTGQMFDRDSSTPTLLGEFKEMIALMLFFIINGHHYLIDGIYLSVKAVPLTVFEMTESTVLLLIKLSVTVLIIGVKLASPILVALFLTNLSLALLARVAPQTNIFMLSFQVKVVVGLLVLLASVPLFIFVTKELLYTIQTESFKVIMSMNPGRV